MRRVIPLLTVLILATGVVPSTAVAGTHCWCQCEWVSAYQRRCRKVCRYTTPLVGSHSTQADSPAPAAPFQFPTIHWSLPTVPREAVVIGLGIVAVVLGFAGIGHFSSIARARRDVGPLTHRTLRADELRRQMDAVASQADDLIDAYRRQAFERGREE